MLSTEPAAEAARKRRRENGVVSFMVFADGGRRGNAGTPLIMAQGSSPAGRVSVRTASPGSTGRGMERASRGFRAARAWGRGSRIRGCFQELGDSGLRMRVRSLVMEVLGSPWAC